MKGFNALLTTQQQQQQQSHPLSPWQCALLKHQHALDAPVAVCLCLPGCIIHDGLQVNTLGGTVHSRGGDDNAGTAAQHTAQQVSVDMLDLGTVHS